MPHATEKESTKTGLYNRKFKKKPSKMGMNGNGETI
jgi:hypothetical protein